MCLTSVLKRCQSPHVPVGSEPQHEQRLRSLPESATARRGGRQRPSTLPPASEEGRLPLVTRHMALAIKLQDMIDRGELRDFADVARLGFVSRARVTQIMNLLISPRTSRSNCCSPPVTRRGNTACGP